MKINEIRLGMSEIKIVAKVTDVSEPREVRTKFGYNARVANAIIEDETGKIKLALWGNKIDEIGEGDKIEITDGYVTEFRGEIQLNVPKKGEIKRIE